MQATAHWFSLGHIGCGFIRILWIGFFTGYIGFGLVLDSWIFNSTKMLYFKKLFCNTTKEYIVEFLRLWYKKISMPAAGPDHYCRQQPGCYLPGYTFALRYPVDIPWLSRIYPVHIPIYEHWHKYGINSSYLL